MSPMNITIIVLISIGVIAIIIALIWTKLIKPNSFAYTNKNFITKRRYKDLISKIKQSTNIQEFNELKLNFDNQKITLIERLFFSSQNVYIISYPIEKKALDVFTKANEIKIKFENKVLDLPLDINVLIANVKIFKRKMNLKNIKLIVPMANEKFKDKEIENIYFVNEEKLETLINNLESEATEFDSKEFLEKIEKYKLKTKERRKPFNLKF